jgi:hypothetical protein
MSTVIGLIMRLRRALGEEITSGDLEVVWTPCNYEFDPVTMEDISGQEIVQSGQDGKGDRVLCTTELGLQRSVRDGPKGGEGSWRTTNLLKSKVALESVAEGMGVHLKEDVTLTQ